MIEPDLQNFIDLALKSVTTLGGNAFAASATLLDVLERLRHAGAATGHPMMVGLVLQDRQLIVQWGKGEQAGIATLPELPSPERVAELRTFLVDSVASVDPEILLQRNIDMKRHFDEARANAERELEILQQSLQRRQSELMEIMHLAETDALTGLYNRRAFDARLRQVFLHTMRQKSSPVSLLFFDLDFFKQINDQHGHQVGDEHLKKMANVLCKVIREDVDFAFRFGGDEFAVVIFADYPQACDKARQVLEMMAGKVSAGITTVNKNTTENLSLEEFIRRADNALYEAKRRGRGRAVVESCAAQANGMCQPSCPEIASYA